MRDPKKRTNLELSGRDTFELEKKKRTKSITSEENIDIDRTNTVVVRKNIFHSPYAEHSSDCSTPRELYDKLRKNNISCCACCKSQLCHAKLYGEFCVAMCRDLMYKPKLGKMILYDRFLKAYTYACAFQQFQQFGSDSITSTSPYREDLPLCMLASDSKYTGFRKLLCSLADDSDDDE